MIHLHEHLALLDMGIVQDLLDVHNGACGDAVSQYQLGGLVGGQILDPLLNDLGNGILIGQTARHIHEPGIGDHVRAFQHLIAELFVQLLVSGGNDDLAALAGEAVVGGNSGITVAHGGRDVAGLDVLQGSVLSGSDHAVHQTHVHPLPFAGNGAGVDCGKDADGYMKSAQNITQRRTGTGGLSALGTGDGHHTAHGLSQNIIARAQVVGTVAAKAGDRRIDDAGIDLLQDIIAQPQLVHHAGAVVFHHDIRFFDKLLEDLLALRGLQVQGDPLFVAVDVGKIDAFPLTIQIFGAEGGIAAGVVTAFGDLDLDDVCPHVSQHHGAEGAGKHTGQVENRQVLQCHMFTHVTALHPQRGSSCASRHCPWICPGCPDAGSWWHRRPERAS